MLLVRNNKRIIQYEIVCFDLREINQKDIDVKLKKLFKKIKIKFAFFFIITLIILFVLWFYIICFCSFFGEITGELSSGYLS